MNDKIKGLENHIQAYIDEHPDCDVIVDYERDVSYNAGHRTSGWFSWKVLVRHKPTEV